MIMAHRGLAGKNAADAALDAQQLTADVISLNRAMQECGVSQTLADSWNAWFQSYKSFVESQSSSWKDYIPIYKVGVVVNRWISGGDLWQQVQDYRARFIEFVKAYNKECPNNPLPFTPKPPQSAGMHWFAKYSLIGLGIVVAGAVVYGVATKQGPRQMARRLLSRGK